MNKLGLYETVLLKLAQEGNADAKLALELGTSIPEDKSVDVSSISRDLRNAVSHCGEALRKNGYEWCSGTDRSINEAVSSITSALSRLI